MNLTKNIYTNKEDYLYRLGNINYDTDIVINNSTNTIINFILFFCFRFIICFLSNTVY